MLRKIFRLYRSYGLQEGTWETIYKIANFRRYDHPLQPWRSPLERLFVDRMVRRRWQRFDPRLHPFRALQIQTRSECDYRCPFCPNGRIERPMGVMEEALFEKIAAELGEMGFSGCLHLYLMSEPLLDERLADLARWMSRRCPQATLLVQSNGSRLDETLYRRLMAVPRLFLTINDYTPDAAMLGRIASFPAAPAARRRTLLVHRRTDAAMTNRSGYAPRPTKFRLPLDRFCTRPFEFLYIGFDGRCLLCCNDWPFREVLGDARRQSLREIWAGESYAAVRRDLLGLRRDGLCRRCDYLGYQRVDGYDPLQLAESRLRQVPGERGRPAAARLARRARGELPGAEERSAGRLAAAGQSPPVATPPAGRIHSGWPRPAARGEAAPAEGAALGAGEGAVLRPASAAPARGAARGSRRIVLVMMMRQMVLGGAETQLVRLIAGLDRRRFDVRVCLFADRCYFREELARLGIPVTVIEKRAKFDFLQLARLAAWLRRQRPQIVQTWITEANSVGTVAAALGGVPVRIACVRNLDLWRTRPRLLYDRLALGSCQRVLSNARRIDELLAGRLGLPREKRRIVYNGLDPHLLRLDTTARAEARQRVRAEIGLPEGAIVFVTVAMMRRSKDHFGYLEAIAGLPADRPFRFLLVGDGELLPAVRAKAERLGIGERVRLAGVRRDIARVLAAADVFVLPSHDEGTPNAVLEAMAAGLPVVATDVGGICDAVEHGRTGLLVPHGDPPALAAALLRLGDDPGERERLGRPGFRLVEEKFSTERMVSAFAGLYEELVSGNGCRSGGGRMASGPVRAGGGERERAGSPGRGERAAEFCGGGGGATTSLMPAGERIAYPGDRERSPEWPEGWKGETRWAG